MQVEEQFNADLQEGPCPGAAGLLSATCPAALQDGQPRTPRL